ncbi:MAG: acyl-CoA dehydrogenase family protein [Actinomycetaceae bacterium]|nr:acyl-CoA dehydrogenase family protein [Actinomycetaceae bacterium]
MGFIPNDILDTIHSRAADHDQANDFPADDLADLQKCGYLTAFVPEEYGGAGLSLREIAAEQTTLAKAAPATALAINMHHIVVGLGRYMLRHGNDKGAYILREAANGAIFGFGISEPGNDLVLFGSITQAHPTDDGGFSFHGTKVFTSLAPVWTHLATFGRWDSPDGPRSVFAILTRNGGGFTVEDDWDTLGMRATQSHTTILEGAIAPQSQVLTITPPGPSTNPVVFGIFANFEILLAATYTGIGHRAIEVAADHVKKRQSVKNQTSYSNDPDIRWRLAEAAIIMDGLQPQIDRLADDMDADVDRGSLWMPQLSALKNRCAESSKIAVEQSIRSCGGSSYFNNHELSRLYRDVLAGLFQPSDQESLHSAWANMVLGPVEE